MRIVFSFFLLLTVVGGYSQQLPAQIQLPNGWKISPVGKSFELGDLPLNIAVSKSSSSSKFNFLYPDGFRPLVRVELG